jgi:hypothetical protein
MDNELFKRGQIEEALWALQWTGRTRSPPPVPSIFRTRIKRLLDLDRMEELPGLEDEDDGTFAFSEEKPGIQGQDMGFSTFDAFAMAIGLELLGGGFKQLDVVALMRSMKSLLRDEFDWIQEIIQDYGTPDYRGHFWSHKQAPKLPISIVDKEEFADHRVYTIIRKVELREIYPLLKQKLAKRKTGRLPPIYIEPCFVRGITELQRQLNQAMPFGYRTATFSEISLIAVVIPQELRKTSAAKRGPK